MAKNLNKLVWLTHANVSLYALCFWIQIGTLPYLTKKLNVNPVTFGNLQTTFGVVQLLGGPIFGRFGDLFGSRAALMVAFASATLSYFLLGLANTVFVVFLSRLPSVFMHAMQGAQMVIADVTEPRERSDSLGKLGLSYGVGMVIGPIIGGLCTRYASEQAAAFVAAFGSLLSIGLVYSFLPPKTKHISSSVAKEEDADVKKSSAKNKPNEKLFDVDLFLSLVWRNPSVRYLMFLKTVSGIPIGVLHSMFSLIAIDHFHLSADLNGYLLSYIGVISMITQGLIVGKLTRLGIGEWKLINGSIAVLCLSYAMLVLVTNVWGFCLVSLPMVMAGSLFSTVIQAKLTNEVSQSDTGSMLGFSMAVHALIRSISPTFGGFLFQYYGFAAFGCLGVLCNGILYAYITVRS